MLGFFAGLATRHARAVLIGTAVFLAAATVGGSGVAEHLSAGGFEDPASPSARAADLLADQFDTGVPNVVLLVTAHSGDIDDPASSAAGEAVAANLADQPRVTDVVSYWSEDRAAPLRNDTGDRALILGRIDTEDRDELDDRIADLTPDLRQDGGAVSVDVGGSAEIFREMGATIEEDLLRAELLVLPITLVLLLVIFGSIAAAGLPIVIGALSVVGTFLVLRVLSEMTEVSIYALNLTTMLGLGLAIDYSMLVVARYREELQAGDSVDLALGRTLATSGRTVAFSAGTVAAALSAMLVFPFAFLRSLAYSGVVVTVFAGVFSLLVLPAILELLGHRVNALTVRQRSLTSPGHGIWYRQAGLVMRRPVLVATAVIVPLLIMGVPFLGFQPGRSDDRVLPDSAATRQLHDVIRREFSSIETGTISVVAASANPLDEADIDDYATRLARLPSVARVDAATGSYLGSEAGTQGGGKSGQRVVAPESSARFAGFTANGGTHLNVVPAVEPYSDQGERLVRDIRAEPSPFPVLVGGSAAELVDTNNTLYHRLPIGSGVLAAITVVLLFTMFGSVVIPLKAIVLNVLSLSATFGVMVWVFQDGHLAGILDITATGSLDVAIPILMFCVAFGLSMDYEVFLLSRIKEEHDHGASNTAAIATGLERTGRIVTAAALLIAVVFLAFATGQVSFIKLFGIGLTLAVLLDAFVIRATLVPAFMRLAGEWNWWAPQPLQRLYQRWGLREQAPSRDGPGSPERDQPAKQATRRTRKPPDHPTHGTEP